MRRHGGDVRSCRQGLQASGIRPGCIDRHGRKSLRGGSGGGFAEREVGSPVGVERAGAAQRRVEGGPHADRRVVAPALLDRGQTLVARLQDDAGFGFVGILASLGGVARHAVEVLGHVAERQVEAAVRCDRRRHEVIGHAGRQIRQVEPRRADHRLLTGIGDEGHGQAGREAPGHDRQHGPGQPGPRPDLAANRHLGANHPDPRTSDEGPALPAVPVLACRHDDPRLTRSRIMVNGSLP